MARRLQQTFRRAVDSQSRLCLRRSPQKSNSKTWIAWTFKAVLVLAGIIAQRVTQGNPYMLTPIPASLVVVGVTPGLKKSGKNVRRFVADVANWVAAFGADYGLGVGVAVLLGVGPDYWGSWMVFAVFFALSVLIISLGDFVKSAASGPVGGR